MATSSQEEDAAAAEDEAPPVVEGPQSCGGGGPVAPSLAPPLPQGLELVPPLRQTPRQHRRMRLLEDNYSSPTGTITLSLSSTRHFLPLLTSTAHESWHWIIQSPVDVLDQGHEFLGIALPEGRHHLLRVTGFGLVFRHLH